MSTDGSGPGMPCDRQHAIEQLWKQVEQLIEGSYLFRSLDEAGRKELLHRGRLVFFPAGSVILREGELGESFFLVNSGVVEVRTRAGGGGEIELTTLQRGAVFGEVAVLTGSPRTATVTALTDVCAVAFDRHDVDQLLASNPKARRLLDAVMTGRARDTAEKVARVTQRPKPQE